MNVVLHSERPPVHIDPNDVYFAFPSGAFSYDCVSCGAQCCRGHGYVIHGDRELQPQIQTHAAVRFFLDPCEALEEHYHVQNFAPGCFFLTKEGRCRIQVERGFAAKPETCRFFPFNNFFRVGSRLVVLPYSQLCPLQVLEPGSSPASDHDALLRTLTDYGIDDHVQALRPISLTEARLIDLERQIVRLSESQPPGTEYETFAATQRVVTERAIREGRVTDAGPTCEATFQRFRSEIDGVLGAVHDTSDDPEVTRLVITMTPTLRAPLVFRHPAEASSGVHLRTLPNLLLAAHSLVQLARRAGMESISYQTVMRVVNQNRPLLVLLSQLNSVLMWRPDTRLQLSLRGARSFQAAYIQIAQALLPHAQRRVRATLGDIVSAHLPQDAVRRSEFVRRLAKTLHGHLVPFDDVGLLNRVVHSPRATVQQLAIGSLPPETVMSLAARRTITT